ncbi:MAG TPA: glycosyltransferase family 39 protein, partial [Polyangiaceae bacterium]
VAALLAATPTVDPDGLGYHLTVPKLWLQSGSLGYLPTYPYSNTPMGVEMLYTIALACVGDAGAKALHFSFGVLGAFGLYLAGKRLRSSLLGSAAVALYLVGPVAVVTLFGCAYLEGITTCAMSASTLAWLIWFQTRKPSWLPVAFALAGIGVSFKITAALFPIALGALTLATLADPARREGKLRLSSLPIPWQVYPLTLLPVAPWLLRSALVTGNPVFPLFARLIPTRDLSPVLSKQFDDYNRYLLWATRFGAHWTIGQRKLILVGVALIAIVLATWLFLRLRQYMARALVLVMLGTVLAQLAAVGLYARYWIPSFALMALPILLALADRIRFSERSAWTLLVAATGLGSLYQVRQGLSTVSGDVRGLIGTALGLESQRSFLLRHLPLYPLYERANLLPPESKILLSTYCGGFYVDRTTYCAESVQDSLRLTAWNYFMADVTRLGATHVFAPTHLLSAVQAGQFATRTTVAPGQGSVSEIYRAQQNEFVGRLLNDHGKLLATATDTSLYEVDLNAPR